MLFKKQPIPYLTLYSGDQEIYSGRLSDLPIRESVILEKSEQFFNDPEPCHIHRNAVRSRLTEEILRESQKDTRLTPGPRLTAYGDFPQIDAYLLTELKK